MYLAIAIDNINEFQLNWLIRVRGCDVFALLAAAMLEVGGFVGLANLGWLGLPDYIINGEEFWNIERLLDRRQKRKGRRGRPAIEYQVR